MKHEGDADPYHYPSAPLVPHSTMNRGVPYDFNRQREEGHGEISRHIQEHFGPGADHEDGDNEDEDEGGHEHHEHPRREMPHRKAREPEARARYAEERPRGLHGRGKLDMEAFQGDDRELYGGLLMRAQRSAPTVSMPTPEYKSEHRHLIHVLRHPTLSSLRSEADKQEREVEDRLHGGGGPERRDFMLHFTQHQDAARMGPRKIVATPASSMRNLDGTYPRGSSPWYADEWEKMPEEDREVLRSKAKRPHRLEVSINRAQQYGNSILFYLKDLLPGLAERHGLTEESALQALHDPQIGKHHMPFIREAFGDDVDWNA